MSSDDGGSIEAARIRAVLEQVRAVVERWTRLAPEEVRVSTGLGVPCPVAGTEEFVATAGYSTSSGTGPLPQGVSEEGPGYANAAAAVVSQFEAALPSRLQEWTHANGARADAMLTAADCPPLPYAFGHAHDCNECHGRGRISCSTCAGSGQEQCLHCMGRGRKTCSRCNGSGRTACSGCSGSGHQLQQRSYQVHDYGTGQSRTEWRTENVPCVGCGGSGGQSCGCGTGMVSCSFCSGSGQCTCAGCGGSGSRPCGRCNATGVLHEVATFGCGVQSGISIDVDTVDPRARATISALRSIAEVAELAPPQIDASVLGGNRIARRFRATIPLTLVRVAAGPQVLDVIGYGDRGQVRNFENVLGLLLEADLAALEAGVAAPHWRLWDRDEARWQRLAAVLDSEAHAEMATTLARTWRLQIEDDAPGLPAGAAAHAYQVRTRRAIGTALLRGYREFVALPTAFCAVLLAMLAFLEPSLMRWFPGVKFAPWLYGAAIVAPVLVAFYARLRVASISRMQGLKPVVKLLSQCRAPAWWAGWSVLGLTAIVALVR